MKTCRNGRTWRTRWRRDAVAERSASAYVVQVQCGMIRNGMVKYSIVQYKYKYKYTYNYSTLQYNISKNIVDYSVVQYSVVQCSILYYIIVQYSMAQCSLVQPSLVQFSLAQYSLAQSSIVGRELRVAQCGQAFWRDSRHVVGACRQEAIQTYTLYI